MIATQIALCSLNHQREEFRQMGVLLTILIGLPGYRQVHHARRQQRAIRVHHDDDPIVGAFVASYLGQPSVGTAQLCVGWCGR